MSKKKILHLFYQSLPDVSGAAVRNHCIVRAQNQSGLFHPIAITPPFQAGNSKLNSCDCIDDVQYFRTWSKTFEGLGVGKGRVRFRKLLKLVSIFIFAARVYSLAKRERVDVIHAHSTAYTGFVGLFVSWLLGAKFVYEIRANWYEDSEVRHASWIIGIIKWGERYLCKKADSLVVICNGLFEQFGALNSNVVIVPNGVMNVELDARELQETPSFGFIGSIIPLENLSDVLEALSILKLKFGLEPKFTIYGGGSDSDLIAQRITTLNLSNVKMMGRISFDLVDSAYNEIDVVVNYRRKEILADKTTPLKPIEAMAKGRLVICSDVAGMLEVTGGEGNVVCVHSNSPLLLAEVMANIYQDINQYKPIAKNGQQFVSTFRLWERNVLQYCKCY
jgi:glycosyltransferase involved in cell wall biosynthesis